MTFDIDHWQTRLDELRITHHVPGASLAVLADDQVRELASGVLHTGTGVEVTTDSVFLAGSLAKAYTATAVMALVDRGRLSPDDRVTDVLPDFATPDPDATAEITVRQLLSHTGGLTCDFTLDTGRGDDAVSRYVAALARVALDCPPGAAMSYSSVGFAVLGRIIEVVTGRSWDRALNDLVLAPAGLHQTMTLPEEALRFQAAMGHFADPARPDDWPQPAPAWDLMPRSAGPYGRVIVSAGDVVRFARMHLADGVGADGTRVLTPESARLMPQRQTGVIDRWTMEADGWGLGWTLYDWDGVPGFGHDGSAVAQRSFLRVLPDAGVAIALLANSDQPDQLYRDLFGELLPALAGVQLNEPFGPSTEAYPADITPHLGSYQREGVRITILPGADGRATSRIRYEFIDGMAGMSPPIISDLVAVDENVWAAVSGFGPAPVPVVFHELPDGTQCCVVAMRVAPRVVVPQ